MDEGKEEGTVAGVDGGEKDVGGLRFLPLL